MSPLKDTITLLILYRGVVSCIEDYGTFLILYRVVVRLLKGVDSPLILFEVMATMYAFFVVFVKVLLLVNSVSVGFKDVSPH